MLHEKIAIGFRANAIMDGVREKQLAITNFTEFAGGLYRPQMIIAFLSGPFCR